MASMMFYTFCKKLPYEKLEILLSSTFQDPTLSGTSASFSSQIRTASLLALMTVGN